MVPPRSKFVSYVRVSTAQQGRSGLGLEAQKAAVDAYLKAHAGVELASFVEVESGKINARPQLEAAMLRCRQTRAILLVAKLDRLSRNAAFLMSLRDAGVRFEAIDIPGANTMTVGVMALVAQQEAEYISQRTRAALAARRARGLSLGTPRDMSAYQAAASAKGREKNTAIAKARAAEIAPLIADARSAGRTSLRQIAAYLSEQETTTPRGRAWTAAAVRSVERLLSVAPSA